MIKLANIVAFILPIGLFFYFTVIGVAALSILRTQKNLLQNILLSPVIGVAFTLVSIFILNRIGFPIKNFIIPLTFVLFLLAIFIILYKKPLIPFLKYSKYVVIFFIALCLSGRPLLYFGFNWISYANDDMANYCLGALRFFNGGYSNFPNVTSLVQGRNYSDYNWFSYVASMVRSGSELLLAGVSGLAHKNPLQIFMPLILTLHLILISSTSAMVLISKKYRKVAFITAIFLTFAPLITLGTLYQLIGQVLGLSILISVITLFQQTLEQPPKIKIYSQSFLLCITICSLLIAYPEFIPFLGVIFFIYLVILLIQKWRPNIQVIKLIALSLGGSVLILNSYWLNIIGYVQYQSHIGLASNLKADIFPYFLIPSGIANLWGIQPLAVLSLEPWLSFSILIGLLLTGLAIFLILKQANERFLPAIVTGVMAAVGLLFYIKLKQQSGFTLFKLSMYIQPFLWAILAAGIAKLKKSKIRTIVTMFIIAMSVVQYSYLRASYGELGQPYNELPMASKTRLPFELHKLSTKSKEDPLIISDTASVVSAKLQALYLSKYKLEFYSQPFYRSWASKGLDLFKKAFPRDFQTLLQLQSKILDKNYLQSFIIEPNKSCDFYKYSSSKQFKTFVLIEQGYRTIINQYQSNDVESANYNFELMENLSNHLIFISSSLGQHYFFGLAPHISLFSIERDYFYPQNIVAGIGRYLLFQMINPSPKTRLVLNITESYRHDGKNKLPPAKIIADKNYPLPLLGRGSARIFSETFSPRYIKDDAYFVVDMGIDGKAVFKERRGLMNLYGRDIPIGNRLLVGHARDISVISEEDYENLTPPSYLHIFPNDLKNKNLAYSGIYEDGWFSEDVSLSLLQINPKFKLTIQGSLPVITRKGHPLLMTVYVDNKKNSVTQLNQGPFLLHFDIPKGSLKRDIRLHFSDYSILPKGDERPVTAKINFIGFKNMVGINNRVLNSIDDIAQLFHNNNTNYSGIYEDGWFAQEASLILAQAAEQKKFFIEGFLPKEKQNAPLLLVVSIDNFKTHEIPIKPGIFKLTLPVQDSKPIRHIKLKFNSQFSLSKKDKRQVAVKINKIGFSVG